MIGQKKFWETVSKQIQENKFPRFAIIAGNRGSGRKLLAERIANALGATLVISGTKADDVREVIEQAYKISDRVLFVFPDAETMSGAAQNALLKVVEEPPNNVYFIMTTTTTDMLLNTIQSRGAKYRVDIYTPSELHKFASENYKDITSDLLEVIGDVCSTPGEVHLFMNNNPKKFVEFVQTAVNNIAEVSGANSFKMGQYINLGEDDTKFDLALFWKAFVIECFYRMTKEPVRYSLGISITCKSLGELGITGINKQMCFDTWLLAIRAEWINYAEN